jgi:hypothetical protein
MPCLCTSFPMPELDDKVRAAPGKLVLAGACGTLKARDYTVSQ